MADYHVSVDPVIYTQYAGGERYRLGSNERPRLTEVSGYHEDAMHDVHFPLAYARQVEERNRPQLRISKRNRDEARSRVTPFRANGLETIQSAIGGK